MTTEWVEEYHGDNKATWACSNGHKWRASLLDNRKAVNRSVGEAGRKFLARYWRKENAFSNQATLKCPHCRRAAAAQVQRG